MCPALSSISHQTLSVALISLTGAPFPRTPPRFGNVGGGHVSDDFGNYQGVASTFPWIYIPEPDSNTFL
jgi:hypothetical protein